MMMKYLICKIGILSTINSICKLEEDVMYSFYCERKKKCNKVLSDNNNNNYHNMLILFILLFGGKIF